VLTRVFTDLPVCSGKFYTKPGYARGGSRSTSNNCV